MCSGVSSKKVFMKVREVIKQRKKTNSVEPKMKIDVVELEWCSLAALPCLSIKSSSWYRLCCIIKNLPFENSWTFNLMTWRRAGLGFLFVIASTALNLLLMRHELTTILLWICSVQQYVTSGMMEAVVWIKFCHIVWLLTYGMTKTSFFNSWNIMLRWLWSRRRVASRASILTFSVDAGWIVAQALCQWKRLQFLSLYTRKRQIRLGSAFPPGSGMIHLKRHEYKSSQSREECSEEKRVSHHGRMHKQFDNFTAVSRFSSYNVVRCLLGMIMLVLFPYRFMQANLLLCDVLIYLYNLTHDRGQLLWWSIFPAQLCLWCRHRPFATIWRSSRGDWYRYSWSLSGEAGASGTQSVSRWRSRTAEVILEAWEGCRRYKVEFPSSLSGCAIETGQKIGCSRLRIFSTSHGTIVLC